MRILVIDDDVQILRVLSRYGRPAHVVESVSTAAEALAILAVEEFDVIVSDVHMPGTDGPSFLAQLHPGNAAKVIFMTGDEPIQRASAARPTLQKPFGRDDFLAAVQSVGASRDRTSDPTAES